MNPLVALTFFFLALASTVLALVRVTIGPPGVWLCLPGWDRLTHCGHAINSRSFLKSAVNVMIAAPALSRSLNHPFLIQAFRASCTCIGKASGAPLSQIGDLNNILS